MPLAKPQQDRSQKSLERFLNATEELLETTLFDDLSVTDICRKAERSVGAFYARFGDKDGLLQELDERSLGEIKGISARLLEEELPHCANLREATARVAQGLRDIFGSRPGLTRTLILHSRIRRDERVSARQREARAAIPLVIEHLLRFSSEIAHPDPAAAIDAALTYALYAMREATLWDARGRTERIGEQALVAQIAHGMWASLATSPEQ